jgi:microcystin-dependent protein
MGDNNFLGELRVFTYNRIPKGWLPCDGRTLNISQYQALYTLTGTQFGGNGTTTFALPDLRGQVTMGKGALPTGNKGGSETVTLTAAQLPPHTHAIGAVNSSTSPVALHPVGPPTNGYISQETQVSSSGTAAPAFNIYAGVPPQTPTSNWAPLDGSTLGIAGGTAAHENRQPVLPLQICIAISGIYPTRN